MSKCTYNYNGVEYSELEFKKILKDLELPLSELSQEDLNLFKEHVMFIHDIQNYRLLNRYTVIHNNGYYDTAIRKVLIPVDSINKENILANIIKFKGLNPLFNLYHLFNEHTIKLIDSTPEIDSKDRLYEYRLAMLLQNNVENTWLNKLLLDLQIGINNTLNTNYDLEVIKNFLSHNINIVESQTVLPDTTESIDVESLLNQLGLDGKTEFEQEPNVEIVDFVTEIRQLANTDISNIQTQNQNKSNELIRLYRIENTNILYDESIEGIVSKREIIGQFFTDSINTVANYLKKNQKEDGINLVYVDIPKSDLDKYHVSNNEFSKTMDVESDNWIIPQSIARNYVDLSSVTKVTGNFLTLNKAKKELTEIINNLPEPKLNNNFIGNFSAEGRGTFEGDGKDKAMRNQAVGFIGELNPNKEDRFDSSTYGSFKHFNNNSIEEERYLENVPEDTSNGNKIMLALNGSIADTDILQKTKDKILELHNRGFEFLVGDMPGGENRIGDDKFIDYLKSIGANFTVFGSGNNSRILYQRVGLTEQQRKNIQELKQLEPAYAVASDEKVQEFIDTIYPDSKIKNLVFRGLSNKSDIVVNNNSYWTPSYRLAEDYIDRQQSTWENLLLDNNQNVEDIPDEKWNSFQPVLQIAVINSQNPYYNNNSVFELDNYENYDTTVGMVSDVQGLEPQILVYSKKQITILNSPETINRFNEFIGNTNPLINEKSLEEAKLPINVEKLFEDEKFANEVYESLGYKNDTTLPDDNKVHKILSDINKQHHLGNIIDLDGYPIYNSEDIIFQNGLKNITSNQWGHGATRIPYGKKGIERLENILSKSDRFTGDFGPIAGTELAKINQYPNTWESGRFIITRDDKDFYDKDGSLNINNIEIILNRSFEPYGNYLANKYPNIIFKDVFGNIIKISNQLTPKQKQEAIHLYSQYLKQNPNGDVENFKSWIEEFKNEIYESLGYDIRQLEEDNMITNLFLEARQDEDNKRINSGEFDDTKLDLKVELQDIIDNSTNPLLVELARSIQYNKSLNSIKAFSTQKPFITSDGFQPAAAYQAETQRLILFLGNKSRFANKERKYQYLLHELVHHFVDRQLILTYSSHANNIKELFKYAKDELTKLGKEILYGLQNAHEFVTEALTNPDFQRELKNLKVSDKFLTKVTSLFDYLLELISNILGTNQSVLEAVITQASDIFEIQEYKKSLSITPEQKQEALSLYSKYVELNPNGNIEEFKSWVNEFNNMTKLQGAYDFSASSNSGKWNSANNELFSLVQDNRRSFFLYKFLIGEVQIFKEIVDYLNENGFNIPYTDRMIRADETMTVEERQSAIDSYNNSVSEKIDNKNQVEKNILFENNLYDETEYTPQELIEKYPLTGVQKVIWNLIKDVVNKLGIKIKFSSSRITESFDGSNNPQNGEILIRPSTLKNGRFGEVLVHEIVHALTTKIISRVNRGVTTGLTKKQISAVKGLMKLYEAVKKDNNLVDKYPVKDVFEFIAHLTNETFVKELESKDKNFLQKIVDFILDILGINNANELAKKYLLDIISDGTFLQENGITILPSDYGNNLQGSLSDFISQKSQEKKFEEKKVQIENEIKKLPIELQELISNNEFIQGAKLAFESSDLKDYGTLENYIDYIARISLGIIRNPTSGEFNNSVVKDIVYHGTDLKNKKNILNKGFQTNNKDLSIRDYIFFARSYNAYGNDAYGVSDKTLIPAVINSKKIQIIEDGTINNSDVKSLFNDKADTLLQILYDVNSYKQGKKLSYEQLEEIREKLELDGLNEIIKNIGFSKEKIIYELENNFESFMENYVNKYGVTNIPFGQLTIHKEQIHILGSKQDIEGFKNWVSSTPQSTNVDENPNQTHIDKINAKYDAELKALGQQQENLQKEENKRQEIKRQEEELNRLIAIEEAQKEQEKAAEAEAEKQQKLRDLHNDVSFSLGFFETADKQKNLIKLMRANQTKIDPNSNFKFEINSVIYDSIEELFKHDSSYINLNSTIKVLDEKDNVIKEIPLTVNNKLIKDILLDDDILIRDMMSKRREEVLKLLTNTSSTDPIKYNFNKLVKLIEFEYLFGIFEIDDIEHYDTYNKVVLFLNKLKGSGDIIVDTSTNVPSFKFNIGTKNEKNYDGLKIPEDVEIFQLVQLKDTELKKAFYENYKYEDKYYYDEKTNKLTFKNKNDFNKVRAGYYTEDDGTNSEFPYAKTRKIFPSVIDWALYKKNPLLYLKHKKRGINLDGETNLINSTSLKFNTDAYKNKLIKSFQLLKSTPKIFEFTYKDSTETEIRIRIEKSENGEFTVITDLDEKSGLSRHEILKVDGTYTFYLDDNKENMLFQIIENKVETSSFKYENAKKVLDTEIENIMNNKIDEIEKWDIDGYSRFYPNIDVSEYDAILYLYIELRNNLFLLGNPIIKDIIYLYTELGDSIYKDINSNDINFKFNNNIEDIDYGNIGELIGIMGMTIDDFNETVFKDFLKDIEELIPDDITKRGKYLKFWNNQILMITTTESDYLLWLKQYFYYLHKYNPNKQREIQVGNKLYKLNDSVRLKDSKNLVHITDISNENGIPKFNNVIFDSDLHEAEVFSENDNELINGDKIYIFKNNEWRIKSEGDIEEIDEDLRNLLEDFRNKEIININNKDKNADLLVNNSIRFVNIINNRLRNDNEKLLINENLIENKINKDTLLKIIQNNKQDILNFVFRKSDSKFDDSDVHIQVPDEDLSNKIKKDALSEENYDALAYVLTNEGKLIPQNGGIVENDFRSFEVDANKINTDIKAFFNGEILNFKENGKAIIEVRSVKVTTKFEEISIGDNNSLELLVTSNAVELFILINHYLDPKGELDLLNNLNEKDVNELKTKANIYARIRILLDGVGIDQPIEKYIKDNFEDIHTLYKNVIQVVQIETDEVETDKSVHLGYLHDLTHYFKSNDIEKAYSMIVNYYNKVLSKFIKNDFQLKFKVRIENEGYLIASDKEDSFLVNYPKITKVYRFKGHGKDVKLHEFDVKNGKFKQVLLDVFEEKELKAIITEFLLIEDSNTDKVPDKEDLILMIETYLKNKDTINTAFFTILDNQFSFNKRILKLNNNKWDSIKENDKNLYQHYFDLFLGTLQKGTTNENIKSIIDNLFILYKDYGVSESEYANDKSKKKIELLLSKIDNESYYKNIVLPIYVVKNGNDFVFKLIGKIGNMIHVLELTRNGGHITYKMLEYDIGTEKLAENIQDDLAKTTPLDKDGYIAWLELMFPYIPIDIDMASFNKVDFGGSEIERFKLSYFTNTKSIEGNNFTNPLVKLDLREVEPYKTKSDKVDSAKIIDENITTKNLNLRTSLTELSSNTKGFSKGDVDSVILKILNVTSTQNEEAFNLILNEFKPLQVILQDFEDKIKITSISQTTFINNFKEFFKKNRGNINQFLIEKSNGDDSNNIESCI